MLRKIKEFLIVDHPTITLVATILILLMLGTFNQFIQDDAFISFRYAENLAQGHGLVWNITDTEPVEGYTNFLWTVLISLPIAFNLDPVLWSKIFGLFFGTGTLFFTYHVSLKVTNSYLASFLSIILLGTNYTFSSYMTGGLETQLQAFLLITAIYITLLLLQNTERNPKWGLYPTLSFLFALAIMTRLDSVLVCGILFLSLSYVIFTNQSTLQEKLLKLTLLMLPSILLVGTWLILKYMYYGDILPNTFYVKATNNQTLLPLMRGVFYTSSFLVNYGLFPFIILGAFHYKKIQTKFNFSALLAIIISVWILYIIRVSGDFMEFRFFVPIMPLLFSLIAMGIFMMPSWKEKTTAILFLLILSFYHATTYQNVYGIESISDLQAHILSPNQDWATIGHVLGEMFADETSSVVISTTAAGAIPYYSKLPTIDMLGLNDKWIARNGVEIDSRPGHSRHTTIQYLLDAEVDLVIGHPRVRRQSALAHTNPNNYFLGKHDTSLLPHSSKIVEIPLNADFVVDVLYISNNSVIDQAIEEFDLVTYEMGRQ